MEKGKLLGILSIVFGGIPLLYFITIFIPPFFEPLDIFIDIFYSLLIGFAFFLPIPGLILGIIAIIKGSRKLGIIGCILNSLAIALWIWLLMLPVIDGPKTRVVLSIASADCSMVSGKYVASVLVRNDGTLTANSVSVTATNFNTTTNSIGSGTGITFPIQNTTAMTAGYIKVTVSAPDVASVSGSMFCP